MKARLPQGYGGGGGRDMNAMLRQAQKMQDEVQRVQEEIEAREFTASSGGGAVQVTCTGKKELLKIGISPDVVDPDDIEMMEDLIIGAVNEALRQVDATMADEMGKVTGGMALPGMF